MKRLSAAVVLALVLIGIAAHSHVVRAQNGGGTESAALAGPFRIVRGQSAIVSVLSPAALNGARRRVDLKFLVDLNNDGVPELLTRSFVLDPSRPSAAIELAVTLTGEMVFEGQSIGRMSANLVAVDIAGHEITHGVRGGEPGTTSSLQLVDSDTGKVTVAVSMGEGERY